MGLDVMKMDILGITEASFLYLVFILLYIMIYAIYFKDLNEFSYKVSIRNRILYGVIGGAFEMLTSMLHICYKYDHLLGIRAIFLLVAITIGKEMSGMSYIIFVFISRFIISGFTIETLKYNLITLLLFIIYISFTKIKVNEMYKWIIYCLVMDDEVLKAGTDIEKLISTLCVLVIAIISYNVYGYSKKAVILFLQYENAASRDFLTKLYNSRYLDDKLKDAYKEIQDNETHTFAFIDIDHFKMVNDNYGHEVGDLVLKQIAFIIQSCCREQDIVARKGGEEFCIILRSCGIEKAEEVLERIRNTVECHKFKIGKNKTINMTISIGAVELNRNNISCENEIFGKVNEADIAMYESKNLGRNRITIY